MRRIAILGIMLVTLSTLGLIGSTRERGSVVEAAAPRTTTPVEVTNFPAVQGVSGTVNVGNLPAVQQVVGTVSVSNLPLDNAGRLPVSLGNLGGAGALTLHSTVATFTGNLGGRTGATQKCRAEFPNSHFATEEEVRTALPARGVVWLTSETDWSWVDTISRTTVNCFEWQAATNTDGSRIDGDLIRTKGTDLFNGGPCSDSHPLICAE